MQRLEVAYANLKAYYEVESVQTSLHIPLQLPVNLNYFNSKCFKHHRNRMSADYLMSGLCYLPGQYHF